MSNDWSSTKQYLNNLLKIDYVSIISNVGEHGVEVLREATPINTGRLASSWSYKVEKTSSGYSLIFHNNDIEGGYNVALLVQMGHGTGRGVYISGRDYINPAIDTIFAELADKLWKEVFA